MEILLTLAFVVVVIVGTKLYKKRVAHMSPKTESKAPVTVGGGGVDIGKSNNGDGSVSPPTAGEFAE
jgi:hypothetical protein